MNTGMASLQDVYGSVGAMQMPPGFRYAAVFRRGRPRHGQPGRAATYDAFYRKHPPMDTGHRAKIFAPFDALRGFSDAIAGREVLYEPRRTLTEEEREELDRRLGILHRLTAYGRLARENRAAVSITWFLPCEDPENEAYGKQGRYQTVRGIVRKVDLVRRVLLLDRIQISGEDSAAPAGEGMVPAGEGAKAAGEEGEPAALTIPVEEIAEISGNRVFDRTGV